MPFNSEIEANFYRDFNNLKHQFITSKKVYIMKAVRSQRPAPYDISIEVGNKIIALIELKDSRSLRTYDYSNLEKFAAENNIRFFVFGDGVTFTIIDRRKDFEKHTTNNLKGLANRLSDNAGLEPIHLKNQIGGIIKEIINTSEFDFLRDKINDLLDQLIDSVEYDEIGQSFFFQNPTNINNVENLIFRFLLKDDKPLKTIYRYTTLSTIFSMLNYNSLRMNCLIGMNDTSEVNYAENYVFGTNRDFTSAPPEIVEAHNKRFISSCSLRKDDLNQWRLYAEDSKGVCLVLRMVPATANSKFIVKRISYGRKNGTHPELELVKNVIARLKEELSINFEFKTLNTWRHFFKPYDYKDEEEVRILYIADGEEAKTEWLLTASHDILNPFVTFKLNDEFLPFQLTEIVLGTKCSEKEINQRQFEQFIRDLSKKKRKVVIDSKEIEVAEYNIDKLKVSISNIRNYR